MYPSVGLLDDRISMVAEGFAFAFMCMRNGLLRVKIVSFLCRTVSI